MRSRILVSISGMSIDLTSGWYRMVNGTLTPHLLVRQGAAPGQRAFPVGRETRQPDVFPDLDCFLHEIPHDRGQGNPFFPGDPSHDVVDRLFQDDVDPRIAGGHGITSFTGMEPVSYTHLRAHETRHDLVCRLLLE